MVSEMSMTVVKWTSLPVLLTGSVFARLAAEFHLPGGYGRGIRGLEAATSGGVVSIRRALALAVAIPFAAMSQTTDPLDPLTWKGKLKYHAESIYSPMAIVGIAAYAGILQSF